MKKVLAISLTALPSVFLTTLVVNAQAPDPDLSYFTELVKGVQDVVDLLVPLIIGIGLVVILWGLVRYATAAGDEEQRKQATQYMLWGVIIFFVMVSIWGLVELLGNLLNVGQGSASSPDVPS